MRNMYANRLARRVTSGSSHGRDSSLTAASISISSSKPPKVRGNCHTCGQYGHHKKDCNSRKQSDNGNRPHKWCSFHRTHTHDNSECRSQIRSRNVNSNDNDDDDDDDDEGHGKGSSNRVGREPQLGDSEFGVPGLPLLLRLRFRLRLRLCRGGGVIFVF